MKNKLIALLIAFIGLVPSLFAADISLEDSKELLGFVETEKDFADAVNLITSSDNAADLISNTELTAEVNALAEELNGDLSSWSVATVEEPVTPEEPSEPVEESASLWGVFLLAFASGFVALIMPCVFPMIPMTVSFFTKRSKTKAQGIKNAMIYGGSIVLIHVLLGGVVVMTGAGELLNELSTNVYFNIFFFLMLFIFGLSFLGAFEIQLPASWVNKADSKADKGGVIGIFFMALVLSLASFSCTGPILGSLLGGLSAAGGSSALMMGMFAFGLALALPFMLFSIFPAWLNSMPSSGGWLNVVKVFLGFLEIAFAFKFLSTADTTMQWHLLEREIFISIWIAVFGTLALYMFGKIRLPHDSPTEKLSVGRSMMGTFVLAFTIYLIPGLWGAPLKVVNAFLPPDFYAESPGGLAGGNNIAIGDDTFEHVEGMHEGPQGIMAFKDYDLALAYAEEVGKPLFVDFTGWGCVNCRKMEQSVWGEPGVIEHLRNDVVIVSLYVDERTELPEEEQGVVDIEGRKVNVNTVGNKWTVKQMSEYKTASQPYYVMQFPDGTDIENGSADYQNHGDVTKFKNWLEEGLKLYEDGK
ncbi:MAG: cytochrome c biogenesis protein CcdA [Crocinitomicaceae bacterium]|nr:cytochrome c biogenesis protein CcdA [Crocinitomicaceae bacterium]